MATAASGGSDTFSRTMLIAAIIAAVGAIVVGLYTLLPGCGGRPTDSLIAIVIALTVLAAAVALVGSPVAWLTRHRSGLATGTARLATALAVLDLVGLIGVGVLVLRATLSCAFGGPGSPI